MSVATTLAIIGGADPDDPLENENRVRHVVVGSVVLLIATWALVAATLAFHVSLRAPWPLAVLGGLIIAGVVACIDILITVTPFKKDDARSRAVVILARGALSLAMGLVISHATVLLIYRDDLTRAVSQTNSTDVGRLTDETNLKSDETAIINAATAAIKIDNDRITKADADLSIVVQEEQRRHDLWTAATNCDGRLSASGCSDPAQTGRLFDSWIVYKNQNLPKAQNANTSVVTAARADLAKQQSRLATATAARQTEVDDATKHVRGNIGLQAQNEALWNILKHDWMAWLWPIFFVVVDLVVALLKGLLGESDFDRRRRSNRALREMLAGALTHPTPAGSSQELVELMQFSASSQVRVERARIERATNRRLESLNRPPRPAASRRGIAVVTAVVLLLAFGGLIVSRHHVSPKTQASTPAPTAAQVLAAPTVVPSAPIEPGTVHVEAARTTVFDLGGGAKLIIPPGAMADGAIVSGSYKGHPSGGWGAQAPSAAPVHLAVSPADAIRGKLTLEFPVANNTKAPAGVDPQAASGISTYNEAKKTWDQVPTSYDAATNMISAQITHFSWWNPFSWDWGKLWAAVVQGFGSLVGTRSGPAVCTSSTSKLNWVRSVDGISNDANVAIHACAELDTKHDNVLDVKIVNNRPYTQILTYGGPVEYGWPGDVATVNDVSYNVLDKAVALGVFATLDHQKELLIPAGGQAAVGLLPENGGQSVWHIGPNGLTIALDLLAYVLGTAAPILFDEGLGVVGCIAGGLLGSQPDLSPGGIRSMLVQAFGCVEAAFTGLVAAKKLDTVKVENLKAVIGVIKSASVVASGLQLAGGALWRVTDFITDWLRYRNQPAGTGFTVTANSTSTAGSGNQGGSSSQGGGTPGGSGTPGRGGTPGGGTPGGGSPGGGQASSPLSFTVTGSCTTAGGTLTGSSSGFTLGGTYTVAARKPDGTAYPGLTTTGHVRADGSAPWKWPCAGDAAGTYTTTLTDNATGRSTGWVQFTIGCVCTSSPPPPSNRVAITSYDRMRGGAPYWGRATKGWQAFTAASNTLTTVGVTWSDNNYGPGATLTGITTRISLCQGVGTGSDPCIGRFADGTATVVNQGNTQIDFGDVPVTPGATYYVFYYQPQVDAGSWDYYWWSCSCPSGRQSSLLSDQNQIIVQGYNR